MNSQMMFKDLVIIKIRVFKEISNMQILKTLKSYME